MRHMVRLAVALAAFVLVVGVAWPAPAAAAPPANDNFLSSQAIAGDSGAVLATNVGATKEPGEPNHAWSSGGASVWFSWTAPADGRLTVSTLGSDFDTVLGVYTGAAVGALTGVASNDNYQGFCSRTIQNVTAGQTYQIAVDGYAENSDADVGNIALAWSLVTAPANDRFANAQSMSPTSDGTSTTSTFAASRETGEPNHAYVVGSASVWYKFTAPSTGGLAVDTIGSDFDTVLGTYTGTNVASLTRVSDGYSDNYGGSSQSKATIGVVSGTTYYVAVDGRGSATGSVELHWHFRTSPANDDWVNRTVLATDDGTVTGSNVGATRQSGEPVFGGWSPKRSVWYSWTAPDTGAVVIDTFGSDYDTLIEISTGTTVTALTELANNDNAGSSTKQSRIVQSVTKGTAYSFGVDGRGGDGGNFALHWHFRRPANDDYADAQVLGTNEGTVTGSTVGASKEAGEPSHGNYFGYGASSIWYKWTAPDTGAVLLDTAGSDFSTLISAYTGSGYGHLTTVDEDMQEDYGYGRHTSRVAFRVTDVTTYSVAIDAYRSQFGQPTGETVLHWRFAEAPPANDAFASAQNLPTSDGTVTGSNLGATAESTEPSHGWNDPYASVWYRWTAPTTTVVVFDNIGSGFNTRLGVYTGSSVSALTEIAQASDDESWNERVSLHAANGTTYRVAIDGQWQDMGDLVLHWHSYAPPANDAFGNAEVISGESGSVDGSNVGAGKEAGEPDLSPWDPGGSSIWYSWTAPRNGRVDMDTYGSGIGNPLVGAFTGTNVASLTAIAVDGGDEVSFDATAGVTYRVALDGEEQATGNLVLNWVMGPENDDFADAEPLAGSSGVWLGDNGWASRETDEPWHGGEWGDTSVWFSWTAPATGALTLDTQGSDIDTLLGVYQGTSLGALAEVAGDDDGGSDHKDSLLRTRVLSGQTYYFAVDGYNGAQGETLLNWLLMPSPPHDDFADARVLATGDGTVTGTNPGATREPTEPAHEGAWEGASVWHRWTASTGGVMVVDTFDSDFEAMLAVYTGGAVADLTRVAGSDDLGDDQRVAFRATAGQTYRIAVDTWDIYEDIGDYALHYHLAPTLANDDFANALTLSDASGVVSGHSFTATEETGEPNHAGNASGASIWYKLTAPSGGGLQVKTDGSDFDTVMGVYTGAAVNTLTAVASDDDGGENGCSLAGMPVESGKTYYIAVDGWGSNGSGYTRLSWRFTSEAPANDAFSSAVDFASDDGTTTVNTSGATRETSEPAHAGQNQSGSVWYRWTAPLTAGSLAVDTLGSDFKTVLAAYEGTTVNSLTAVATGRDTQGPGRSRLALAATPGRTYRVALAGEGRAAGQAQLHWHFKTRPPNDDFVNRQVISGEEGTAYGDNLAATAEAGEPAHTGAGFLPAINSVWYEWTAPVSGVVSFDCFGSDFTTCLVAYSGDSLTALSAIARHTWGDFGNSWIGFPVRAGRVYKIVVDRRGANFNAGAGNVVLNWRVTPAPANDDFADGEVLAEDEGSLLTSTEGATKETSEPAHAGNAGGGSIWYEWTAPGDGVFNVDTFGSTLDTLLGVYSGDAVDGLTMIAGSDNADGNQGGVTLRAASGTTYHVAVDGKNGARGDVALRWRYSAGVGAPPNDDFAAARTLTGATGSVTGTTVGATHEASEPVHASGRGRSSVWYSWTAPGTGQVVIDTFGSDFDTLLGVYDGTSVARLVGVEDNNDVGGRSQSRVTFDATSGARYMIAVDGDHCEAGSLRLRWRMPSAPANDAFAAPQVLSGMTGDLTGTTFGATRETSEPLHAGEECFASVWYSWTPSVTATVKMDTIGSDFDTVLAVYTGSSLGALTEVASNDDSEEPSCWQSQVSFSAGAGRTYLIAVDGYEEGDAGDLVLRWRTAGAAPSNDMFASSREITGTVGSLTGSNVGATKESGEPNHAGDSGGSSVWHSWTAPEDGVLTLDTSGSAFNTLLGVYSGTAVNSLTRLTSNDNAAGSLQSRVAFRVNEDSRYAIALDGYDGAWGSTRLNWSLGPPVTDNDDFVRARTLSGAEGTTTASNASATKETGEPDHAGNAGGHSLWYKWRATDDGTLTVDTLGSDFDTLLGVYTGTSVDSLTALGSNDDTGAVNRSSVVLPVAASQTYRIAVDGSNGATGTAVLHWAAQYVLPSIGPVQSFAAAKGGGRARLTWVNPSGGFAGVRVLRSQAGYATGAGDTSSQAIAYEGSATSTVVSGLTNGVPYYFTAFSRHTAGAWSVPATATVTPGLVYPSVGRPTVSGTPRRNRTFYTGGSVSPAHWGSSSVSLRYYRKSGRRWVKYRFVTVPLAAGARSYRKATKLPYTGYWYVYAQHSCTDHRAKSSSKKYFTVRR